MTVSRPISLDFAAPNVATSLATATSDQLDTLDFGVVEMDLTGQVLRYNATEARYSGLAPARVVGRHFFREVAPCSNNRKVAHRFNEAAVDETIAYTFALKMKPIPVTLRMIKSADAALMYLLVRWS